MGAKEARLQDDGREDPDNPIVPFRLSDRLEMYRLRWLLYAVIAISATGTYGQTLIGHVMAHLP